MELFNFWGRPAVICVLWMYSRLLVPLSLPQKYFLEVVDVHRSKSKRNSCLFLSTRASRSPLLPSCLGYRHERLKEEWQITACRFQVDYFKTTLYFSFYFQYVHECSLNISLSVINKITWHGSNLVLFQFLFSFVLKWILPGHGYSLLALQIQSNNGCFR